MLSKAKTIEAVEVMATMFPNAACELTYHSSFELLIAVMLSAQTTDIAVNKVTPKLFQDFPTPEAFVFAEVDEIMADIRSIGLYRNKAKNVKACCALLIEKHKGHVPKTMEELILLPGVGRKTANVVLGEAFGVPSIAVDTHVERVSKRLRICKQSASVLEVEQTLMKKVPKDMWTATHHRMIFFGRYHCIARSPHCDQCPLFYLCQEGQNRLKLN